MNDLKTLRSELRGTPRTRRGSVMALMAFILPLLALLAAFCVNTAHMQLTRTELTIATDAAARAGGRAFSEVQTVSAAKTAAKVTAALNTVNGEPLKLREDDAANEIEFGTTLQYNGTGSRYNFQKIPTSQVYNGGVVASAVRVNGIRDFNSLSGRVPLIIPGLLDKYDFGSSQNSVAMQVDRDISMIIDRSGSMGWRDVNWPYGMSPWYTSTKNAGVSEGLLYTRVRRGRLRYYYSYGVSQHDYEKWAWEDHYGLGPYPTTPWEDLILAVDAFLDVLDTTSQEEQVSLASYATTATLDTWLEKDHQVVRDEVNSLYPSGNTAIGLGMEEGINALLAADARPYAAKTMVVMTDGVHNTGISPLTVANNLVGSYMLTIHTVTFGAGADQNLMQQVAAAGGGKHYHAADGDQLISIFEEIANNLPTILTK